MHGHEDLDELDTGNDTDLKVEICVGIGKIHTVGLSTLVTVRNWRIRRVQAIQMLTGIVDLLMKAIPVETLKGQDRDYSEIRETVLNKDGSLGAVPKEIQQALKGQSELKKRMPLPREEEQKEDENV